jgi:hypothetical protein
MIETGISVSVSSAGSSLTPDRSRGVHACDPPWSRSGRPVGLPSFAGRDDQSLEPFELRSQRSNLRFKFRDPPLRRLRHWPSRCRRSRCGRALGQPLRDVGEDAGDGGQLCIDQRGRRAAGVAVQHPAPDMLHRPSWQSGCNSLTATSSASRRAVWATGRVLNDRHRSRRSDKRVAREHGTRVGEGNRTRDLSPTSRSEPAICSAHLDP